MKDHENKRSYTIWMERVSTSTYGFGFGYLFLILYHTETKQEAFFFFLAQIILDIQQIIDVES